LGDVARLRDFLRGGETPLGGVGGLAPTSGQAAKRLPHTKMMTRVLRVVIFSVGYTQFAKQIAVEMRVSTETRNVAGDARLLEPLVVFVY